MNAYQIDNTLFPSSDFTKYQQGQYLTYKVFNDYISRMKSCSWGSENEKTLSKKVRDYCLDVEDR